MGESTQKQKVLQLIRSKACQWTSKSEIQMKKYFELIEGKLGRSLSIYFIQAIDISSSYLI